MAQQRAVGGSGGWVMRSNRIDQCLSTSDPTDDM